MKIKKLLFLVMLSLFAISCSKDGVEDQETNSASIEVSDGQFDKSNFGVYKGLFTTSDGLMRGSVVVTLTDVSIGLAELKLHTGEVILMKSSGVQENMDVTNLAFATNDYGLGNTSFSFSVERNGNNPKVQNVLYDNRPSDILIAKDLSRAPLNTITGTYIRTAGAGDFPTSGRTWNVMFIGMGDQNYAAQIFYSGSIYNTSSSSGTQSNCNASGVLTTCDINGSTTLSGIDVSWTGTHTYNNVDDNQGCSEVSGTWSAPSYVGSSGTFVSDSNCSDPIVAINDICENAIPIACGETAGGSTSMATSSDAPSGCDDDLTFGNGVWYSFTSDDNQGVTISTNGSSFDTILGVFSGSCGSLVCVGSDDDGGTGLQSQLSFNASLGETYYIYLVGYDVDDFGDYGLTVSCGALIPEFMLNLTCGDIMIDNGGFGNYADDSNDTYSIDAGEGNTVSLEFSEFNVENTWDFVRVYDGADATATEITMSVGGNSVYVHATDATRNGYTGTGANSLAGDSVVSTGRYLTVVFESDFLFNNPGFQAEVVCVAGRSYMGLQRNSTNFTPLLDYSISVKAAENPTKKSKRLKK